MNYYYYPLSSKDFTFENIFSSESVSPPCIYQLRAFGTDFFNLIPKYHHSEAIILYGDPPEYELDKEFGDHIKFILKIPEGVLDPNEIVFISEKVIGYQKTIYLSRNNFQLLFFSEKEITVCSLKSEATLSTKSYKKYSTNFKIISDSDCKPFETNVLENVNVTKDWRSVIEFDRKFNFFKGFCYGLLSGSLRSLSKKEAELKRSLQDITNSFAVFKNKWGNDIKKGYDKGSIRKIKTSKEEDNATKVFKAIESSERLFKSIVQGSSNFQESDVEIFITQFLIGSGFHEGNIKLFIEFKKMEDVLLGTSNFSKFKSQFLKSDHKNPFFYFESLKEQVKAYESYSYSTADWAQAARDKAADSFKKIMYDLSKIADSQATKPGGEEIGDLQKINYSLDDNEINIESGFKDISSLSQEEFVLIANIVLKNPKLGKGDAQKEDILYLVNLVGSQLNQNKPGKESHLYQYLSGEINEYDANKVQSIAMKNFIAFVFNPNSLEKMESYLLSKDVEHKWMAYSFWSAFNGFANMSRFFVAPYFEIKDSTITDPIENVFNRYHLYGNLTPSEVNNQEIVQSETKSESPDQNKEHKIRDFYAEFVEGKFKLSLEQFEQIIGLSDPEKMIDELKTRHRIPKKDGTRLIERYTDIVKSPSLFQ